MAVGAEYYSSPGTIGRFDPWDGEQRQLFPVIGLNVSPVWEINFGVGFGLTRSTDDLIVKLIAGYRCYQRALRGRRYLRFCRSRASYP